MRFDAPTTASLGSREQIPQLVEADSHDQDKPNRGYCSTYITQCGTQCATALNARRHSMGQMRSKGHSMRDAMAIVRETINHADSDMLHSDFYIEQSIWSTPLLLFLPEVGMAGSVYALFLLTANVLFQLLFAYLVMNNLTDAEFDDESNKELRMWRRRVAHDVQYMSSTGSSLASRVCAGDAGLTVGADQAELYEYIDDYLNEISDTLPLPAGPVKPQPQRPSH